MRTAIEHAGAERGLLISPEGNELRIEAEASTSGDTIKMHLRGAPAAAPLSSLLSLGPAPAAAAIDYL